MRSYINQSNIQSSAGSIKTVEKIHLKKKHMLARQPDLFLLFIFSKTECNLMEDYCKLILYESDTLLHMYQSHTFVPGTFCLQTPVYCTSQSRFIGK